MTRAQREKEWEIRIAQYQASGQSAKEWCAANNIKPERLWYWLRRNETKQKSTRWLPVEVAGQPTTSQHNTLLIKVGEASIEVKPGFNPDLLSETIRVLVTLC